MIDGFRRLRGLFRCSWFVIPLIVCAAASLLDADEPERLDFARDIRPILAESCLTCHGPDDGARHAGLRLDTPDGLAADLGEGLLLIEPGDPDLSELIFRVETDEPTLRMPPPGSGQDKLPASQVVALRRWIEQGAAWSDHWSFRRPTRPDPPAVSEPSWSRNPIDRFVLERLDREGLAPSPEADRATLIRRLSLDLIGLPPTPEAIDAFVADDDPQAYDRLVDRLLNHPAFGERWGRLWLDLARYADTNGYEKDRDRSVWPYRDWVIAALNSDMPFDQFTVEQIAGDMLPDADDSQRVATGFHRNTMINEEGGIDVEEFRYESVVDRVATTGSVWLGLTVGCAQCHTHKYDPITHRDYFGMFAMLNNADEPELVLPDPDITARREPIEDRIATLVRDLPRRFPLPGTFDESMPRDQVRRRHLDERRAAWEADIPAANWTILKPTRLLSRKGATMEMLDDGSVLVSGDMPNQDVYEVDVTTDMPGITALRLEVLPHESLPAGGPGRAPLFSVGDFLLTEFELAAHREVDAPAMPVALARATHSYCEKGNPAALAIDGVPDTGWNVKGRTGQPHAAVFQLEVPLGDGRPTRLELTLHQEYIHQMTIGRFRVSVTADSRPAEATGLPAEIEEILCVDAADRTADQAGQLRGHYLSVTPELAEAHREIEALRTSLPPYPTTMMMRERRAEHARTTRVHNRGEFLQPTEPVEPGFPSVLHPVSDDAPRDRLALARWLVAEENPLAGRVTMNRLWAAYFGRGIVATVEDFGSRGELPTHPELLDWLAVEFADGGWKLKRMHRLIVTSATYRQDSRTRSELLARDPENRLLARGPRFRLDAELIRDLALAASGQLDLRIGGPSVYPPQPESVTALAYGGASWPTSAGRDRYRRGLYTFLKRTAPFASSITFDAPTGDTACLRRERSNTPLQALTLLNDPVFVDASQAMARRVVSEIANSEDAEARVTRLFRLLLGRAPSSAELGAMVSFYRRQRTRFEHGELDARAVAGLEAEASEASPFDPVELAAWTAIARVLMNLDETITKE